MPWPAWRIWRVETCCYRTRLMLIKVGMLVLSVLFLGGCNAASSGLSINTSSASGALEPIPATLLKPDGAGPFPAVVIMHDCSGLGPRSSGAPDRWARELLTQGYVAHTR